MDIQFESIEYDKELMFEETPWASDSSIEYLEVAEQLKKLDGSSEAIKLIGSELINESFSLPNELGIEVDPEEISGAISPSSIGRYIQAFNQLDFGDFESSTVTYLEQWINLLAFSSEKKSGIYFHLG